MRAIAAALLAAFLVVAAGPGAAEEVILGLQPLYQMDYAQYAYTLGGVERTVASSGCSVVCLSMALNVLRPEVEQTPETLFQYACQTGLYRGEGLSVEQLRMLAGPYDIVLEGLPGRASAVRDALMEGCPVLAATAAGPVFPKGHYILLYGVDAQGFYRVADPGSQAGTDKAYGWSDMFPEGQTGDLFYAFRTTDILEQMSFRVNALTQNRLRRVRDAR